jgi:hypothetical protein
MWNIFCEYTAELTVGLINIVHIESLHSFSQWRKATVASRLVTPLQRVFCSFLCYYCVAVWASRTLPVLFIDKLCFIAEFNLYDIIWVHFKFACIRFKYCLFPWSLDRTVCLPLLLNGLSTPQRIRRWRQEWGTCQFCRMSLIPSLPESFATHLHIIIGPWRLRPHYILNRVNQVKGFTTVSRKIYVWDLLTLFTEI